MSEKINFLPILQKNRQFQDSLYHIPDLGIALLDSDGSFLSANQFFTDELGYTQDEILGMNYRSITSPVFLYENNIVFDSLIAGEKPDHTLIKKIYRKDGSALFVIVRAFPFHSEIGNRKKILCFYSKDMRISRRLATEIIYKECSIPPEQRTMGILICDEPTRKINIAHGPFISQLELTEKTMETLFFLDQIMEKETINTLENIPENTVDTPVKLQAVLLCPTGRKVVLSASALRFQWNSYGQRRNKIFLSFHEKEEDREILIQLQEDISQLREMTLRIADKLSVETGTDERKSPLDISRYNLTPREKVILSKFAEVNTVKEIAYDLQLAEVTVRKHLTKIYRKFDVPGKEELLLFVYNKNFING